uniref:C3H1-type domain-containing protein n=1 Tax=Romanomermis culicivorax TaxID=13658 RepID=A0A915JXN6_ROMCU
MDFFTFLRHVNRNSCTYSFSRNNLCPYAHTFEELVEWNRRIDLIENEKRLFFPKWRDGVNL